MSFHSVTVIVLATLVSSLAAASLALAAPAASSEAEEPRRDDALERAREILGEVPLVDGHNDLPYALREKFDGDPEATDLTRDRSGEEPRLHTDLARLEEGRVGAQFWSAWVPTSLSPGEAVQTVVEQIDLVERLTAAYPDHLTMAYTADDIERIHERGEIASLIGMEGGHSIGGSLAVLRQLYELGARYMTLTHGDNTPWADSATDEAEHGGLTDFGREVVAEMNRLGMIVDLSHVSRESMMDALDATTAPAVFSHSSARALTDHPRNVPDDVLRRLPENGGVVMVTFVGPYVSQELYEAEEEKKAELEERFPQDEEKRREALREWRRTEGPRATLEQVADHIDHVVEVAGIDHLGIGSDYDGTSSLPTGLEDVSRFPHLFAELIERGYDETELKKIAGLNVLRVMREVEEVAAEGTAVD